MKGDNSVRMEAISRLAVEYLNRNLARDSHGPRPQAAFETVDMPPVRLSLDLMTDQAAAREIAAAIQKALSKVGLA